MIFLSIQNAEEEKGAIADTNVKHGLIEFKNMYYSFVL